MTETEEAIRAGYNYDSEKSDHSVDLPIDLRDEYPEHFEEVEQEEYRRYRLRGGAKRFRPSDIGDEEIYRTLDLPPINETSDGWYHNDHAHLSPTVDRLAPPINSQMVQSTRPPTNNPIRTKTALATQLVKLTRPGCRYTQYLTRLNCPGFYPHGRATRATQPDR